MAGNNVMKTSGGRRKSRSDSAKILVVILLLAVIIILAVWIISQGSSKSSKVNNPINNNFDTDISDLQPADGTTYKILLDETALPNAVSPVQEVNETGTTKITFDGSSATVSGAGAQAEGGYVIINRAGVYELSGTLANGRIVVNAKGEDVVLVLNGVNITCSNSSPLYVYKASTVTLIANGKTENVFTDGSDYDFSLDFCDSVENEPNAAIFSKADLIIRGTGTISVKGNYASGIIGKDNLKIVNTTVNVDAVNNGINGKDSLTIQNSTVNVNAGNDGLRSTKDNDPELGYGVFTDSNIYVTSGGDGVQIETGLTVENSTLCIKTGGGSFADGDGSQKGIKCNQGYVSFKSGAAYFDCTDDAFNVAGNLSVSGGVINILTGDDALHSDSAVNVSGGTIVVTMCNEGLEGMSVDISGGTVYVNSKSDGINAAGGSDHRGFDGFGGDFAVNENNSINISGGYIYLNADGDGVDSNGSIYLSGGTLIVAGPSSGADGAIDYSEDFYLTGGTLLAYGAGNMAQAPDNLTQNCISVTFDGTVESGKYINISGNGESFTFLTENIAENVVFSSPMLVSGEEYTVSYGGKYSGGTNVDSVYSGGKYTGGDSVKLTIDDYLSTYGQVGMGGSMSGQRFGEPGAKGGFHGEGKSGSFAGGMQQGGELPQEPPQGDTAQAPDNDI